MSDENKKTKININQEAVINLDHRRIVVSAGAGTGKTTAMTARAVKIIREEQERPIIDNMLILTFTKAAANVMKEKIEKLLRQHIADVGSADPKEKERLIDAVRKVDIASIQTFHSFCTNLIKTYHHYLDVDPGFTVLEEHEIKSLLAKSFEEAFRESSSEGTEMEKLYINLDYIGNSFNTEQAVMSVIDFINNFPEKAEAESIAKMYYDYKDCAGEADLSSDNADAGEPSENKKARRIKKAKDCDELVKKYIDEVYEIFQNYKNFAVEDEYCSLVRDKVEKHWDDIEKLINMSKKGGSHNFSKFSFTKKYKDMSNGDYEKSDATIKAYNEEIKNRCKVIRDIIEYKSGSQRRLADEFVEQFNMVLSLAYRTMALFKEKKVALNAVDFNDQERYAYNLLSRHEDVLREVRDRYKYVFVDENQDTSKIQNKIIDMIAKDSYLFKVGDVKQGIYKFRNADIETFKEEVYGEDTHMLDLEQSWNEENSEELTDVKVASEFISDVSAKNKDKTKVAIPMNINYRSSAKVLDFVNKVFEKQMPDLYRHANLVSNKEADDIDEPEAVFYYTPKKIEDKANKFKKRQKELNAFNRKEQDDILADIVHELIEEGFSPNEIVILQRSLKDTDNLKKIFAEKQIPFEIQKETNFFKNIEIISVLNAIKAILNPHLDIEMLGLLSGPFVNLSSAELFKLRQYQQFLGESSIYSAIDALSKNRDTADAADTEILGQELSDKLLSLHNMVTRLRLVSNYESPHDFLWRLYNLSDYYKSASDLQKERLNSLSNYFLGDKGIYETAEMLLDSNANPTAEENSRNAVRLMSIHKSKGMEFDVVIIRKIDTKFNFEDTKRKLIVNNDFGFSFKFLKDEMGFKREHVLHNLIKEEIKGSVIEEEKRLLYVAMTRAKKRLIFVGNNKDNEKTVNDADIMQKTYDMVKPDSFYKVIMQYITPKIRIPIMGKTLSDEALARINQVKNKENTAETLHGPLRYAEYKKIDTIKDKLPRMGREPKFDENPALLYGTKQHRALELCDFRQIILGPDRKAKNEDIADATKRAREFIREKGRDAKVTEERMARINSYTSGTSVSKFLSSDFALRIACSDEIYKETPYSLIDEEGRQQGIIDLFFIEDGKIILVDYKTDRYSSEEELERIKEDYQPQLDRYKKVLEMQYNKPVAEAYLYLLHKDGRLLAM